MWVAKKGKQKKKRKKKVFRVSQALAFVQIISVGWRKKTAVSGVSSDLCSAASDT